MKEDWRTANPLEYKILQEKAKHMRQYPTEAERVLWTQLRSSQLGVKFLRQYVIWDYIADFVSLEKKLIIEVDGGYHLEADQQEADNLRTYILESLGYQVVRFTNEEVLLCIDEVKKKISKLL